MSNIQSFRDVQPTGALHLLSGKDATYDLLATDHSSNCYTCTLKAVVTEGAPGRSYTPDPLCTLSETVRDSIDCSRSRNG